MTWSKTSLFDLIVGWTDYPRVFIRSITLRDNFFLMDHATFFISFIDFVSDDWWLHELRFKRPKSELRFKRPKRKSIELWGLVTDIVHRWLSTVRQVKQQNRKSEKQQRWFGSTGLRLPGKDRLRLLVKESDSGNLKLPIFGQLLFELQTLNT